jgi:hypothetical protein
MNKTTRNQNYPGKISPSELEQIKAKAERLKLTPARFVRQSVGLEPIKFGPPSSNKNAKKSLPNQNR